MECVAPNGRGPVAFIRRLTSDITVDQVKAAIKLDFDTVLVESLSESPDGSFWCAKIEFESTKAGRPRVFSLKNYTDNLK
jgi:hypothetical protein